MSEETNEQQDARRVPVRKKKGKPKGKRDLRAGQQRLMILRRERERKAVELRKMGATYQQIADQVGYSNASAASKAVKRAIEKIVTEPAMDLRKMQVERLNHMLLTMWPAVNLGDTDAIRTALQVMQRLDALMGTESPTSVNVHHSHEDSILVIDGNKEEYLRNLKRMAGVEAIKAQRNQEAIETKAVEDKKALEAGDQDSTTEAQPMPKSSAQRGRGSKAGGSKLTGSNGSGTVDITPYNFNVNPGEKE